MKQELTRRNFLAVTALAVPTLSLANSAAAAAPKLEESIQADLDAKTARSFLVSLFQIYKSDLSEANQNCVATAAEKNLPQVCRRVLSGIKGNPELSGERGRELLKSIESVAGAGSDEKLEAGINEIVASINSWI